MRKKERKVAGCGLRVVYRYLLVFKLQSRKRTTMVPKSIYASNIRNTQNQTRN